MNDLRVPDVAGEIIGFRAWIVVGGPRRPRLRSVTYSGNDTIWLPGQWTVAVCSRRHDVPGESCSCGIYAAWDRPHLVAQGYNHYGDEELRVIGQVGLAGKVIRHERGWRAQRARPVRIWVPYEAWRLATALKREYLIPVGLSDTFQPIDLPVAS